MKQTKFISVALALIVVLAVTYALWTKNDAESIPPQPRTYELQADDQGEVTVAVQPLDISEKNSVWRFQVTLNTHSRELNEDLAQAAELRNNKDERFETIGWEGDPAEGHHRSGVLSFRPLLLFPSKITLRLRDVGGVPERTFIWRIATAND